MFAYCLIIFPQFPHLRDIYIKNVYHLDLTFRFGQLLVLFSFLLSSTKMSFKTNLHGPRSKCLFLASSQGALFSRCWRLKRYSCEVLVRSVVLGVLSLSSKHAWLPRYTTCSQVQMISVNAHFHLNKLSPCLLSATRFCTKKTFPCLLSATRFCTKNYQRTDLSIESTQLTLLLQHKHSAESSHTSNTPVFHS